VAGAVALLGAGGCDDETTAPTAPPSISLAVVPSPVGFSVLPPRTEPVMALCCPTLLSSWTLVAVSSEPADLVSVTITLWNRATGFVYVDRRSDRSQLGTRVPTHVGAGEAVTLAQALLETMPPNFSATEPLSLRLEVTFSAGEHAVSEAVEPPFQPGP